ncbi:MAG TPA: hypothetical protein VEU62_03155 [Bryobacterales bacterium]|nr:hypothetical protein [Bryobacterales bacterium]
MRAIGVSLRFFAFLFNLILCLALFFVSLLVMPSGQQNIQLTAVPLKGAALTNTLLLASIYGFVAMVLALRRGRAARFPMLLWNLVVLAALLAAPLRGQFSFANREQAMQGVYFTLAALVALGGAWLQWRSPGRPAARQQRF